MLLAASRFVDLAKAVDKFDEYPWPQLSAVLALSLLYYLLKALRWHYLLHVIEIHLPLRRSLLLYLAGQWFAVTPAGEFVRAYLLTGYGYSLGRASSAVTAQIVFDLLSLAIVGSVAVFWYGHFAAVTQPFTIALLLAILLFSYSPNLLRRGSVISTRQSGADAIGWRGFYWHSRQLLGWRPLMVGLAFALPTVLAGAATLFVVADGYRIAISFGQSAYIYSLSQLAGAISMLPHGLGAIETSSVALFHYAGIDSAYSASVVILFRLCTLGWGLVIGAVSLVALRTRLAGPAFRRVQ